MNDLKRIIWSLLQQKISFYVRNPRALLSIIRRYWNKGKEVIVIVMKGNSKYVILASLVGVFAGLVYFFLQAHTDNQNNRLREMINDVQVGDQMVINNLEDDLDDFVILQVDPQEINNLPVDPQEINNLPIAHQEEINDLQRQLSRKEEDHKKDIADLKEAHQKDMRTLQETNEEKIEKLKEDHQKDIADLKMQNETLQGQLSRMEDMMQQMLANQQQNGNAQ